MKFDGNILDGWFQDELSREKVKLSGHSVELAYCKTGCGLVESRGLGAIRKIFQNIEIENGISRVGRIVGDNREFFIVFILLFIKSNEVQTKLRYVRLLLILIWVGNPVRSGA